MAATMELGKQAVGLGLCVVAAYLYSLSRFLAARTAELIFDGIHHMAASPVEVSLLALLALCVASWGLDRHAKAAQLFSSLHLRLLSSLLIQTAQQQQQHLQHLQDRKQQDQKQQQLLQQDRQQRQQQQEHDQKQQRQQEQGRKRQAPLQHGVQEPAAAAAPTHPEAAPGPAQAAPSASPGPGPANDISSFRLPEQSAGGAGGSGASRRVPAHAPHTHHAHHAAPPPAGRAGRHAHQRWSVDAGAGVGSQAHRRALVGVRPKPRTSLDFEVAPATPRRSRPQSTAAAAAAEAHRRRARRHLTAADHRSAPRLEGPSAAGGSPRRSADSGSAASGSGRREERWQPRMQRIASGQQLAALGAARRGSLDDGSLDGAPPSAATALGAAPPAEPAPPRAAAAPAPALQPPPPPAAAGAASPELCSVAAAVSASGAAAAPPAALSGWLPLPGSAYLLSWTPFSQPEGPAASNTTTAPSTPRGGAGHDVGVGGGGGGASEAADPSDPSGGAAPPSPVSQWVASTGTACAAWASSTVEALLGRSPPFAALGEPGRGPAAGQGPATAASVPLPATPARRRAAGDGRRQSVDGASARHYRSGSVQAHPERRQALERLAAAARLQPGAAGQSPAGCDAAASALASVGLDGDCPQDIRDHVTDEHLLQFAALVGEAASTAAAEQLGLPPAWAHDACLLGAADDPGACSEAGWEQVIDRQAGGLCYQVWRQPLRKGLYMYRSRAFFPGISPSDLRPFHNDDHARDLWDENVLDIRRLRPAGQPGARLHRHTEWCLHQYRSRFPRPMAAREYQYARRVWHRPSDGGCYALCRGLPLPDAGDAYRAVKVTDFASGCVIRGAAGGGGAELLGLYFEDSLVRPGLAKMAVKGMWAYMQHYEAALRVFAEARQAAAAAPRRSLDCARPSLPAAADAHTPGQEEEGEGEEDPGSSSGDDDATSSAYAAMVRHLGRAGRAPSHSSRWAGRLFILAGIKMAHTILSARR